MFKQTPIPAKATFYIISRGFVSCLGCQHFISDWLKKPKPKKLSTGCQNELKGAAVEKATNPGRRFLFFSRLRLSFSFSRSRISRLGRSCARLDKTAMLRRLRLKLSLACVAGDLAASAVVFWQRSSLKIGNKLRRDSHLSLASNGRSAAKKVLQAQ